MRVLLDVGVAIVALQAAVHAGIEFVAIDRVALAGCVLHGLVAMTSQAIRLRRQPVGQCEQEQGQEAKRGGPVPSNGLEQAEKPLGWADNNSNEVRNDSCGFRHAAVSSSMVRKQLHLRTWLPHSGFLRLFGKLLRGLHLRGDAFSACSGSDSCHNCRTYVMPRKISPCDANHTTGKVTDRDRVRLVSPGD